MVEFETETPVTAERGCNVMVHLISDDFIVMSDRDIADIESDLRDIMGIRLDIDKSGPDSINIKTQRPFFTKTNMDTIIRNIGPFIPDWEVFCG